MTDQLPAPLVSAEVDLRDFAFMPLDVARLRDSDLASDETPESCWAAVLLWCAAWHQVPAASIPASDQWQAKQCGYVSQGRVAPAWRKVRAGALRGWVECSDGRLYHPVVAVKALDAWRSKLAQRHRSECARIKKHNQRHGTTIPCPDLEDWIASGCPSGHLPTVPEDIPNLSQGQTHSVPGETPSKGQGEGQGQGQGQGQGEKEIQGSPVLGADAAPPKSDPPGDPPPPAAAKAPAPPRGTRLPKDWALPKAWGEWALAKYPQWTADKVRDEGTKFRNHWTATTGKAASKLDWLATWQNWCMNDIAHREDPKPNGSHYGRPDIGTTVAHNPQVEATQKLLREQAEAAAKATPPPAHVLALRSRKATA